MSYKACFECELLFEVDDDGSEPLCPQCNGPLEDHVDDEYDDDWDADEKTIALVGGAAASPILASVAFDGLSTAVRHQLAAAKQDKTRMLDAIKLGPGLARTEAIDVSGGLLPPLTKSRDTPSKRKYGQIGSNEPEDSVDRSTRIQSAGDEAPPSPRPVPIPTPKPVAFSARPPQSPSGRIAPSQPRRTTPRQIDAVSGAPSPQAKPFVPNKPEPSSARKASKARSKTRSKTPLFIIAGVALLGGAIAAFMLLRPDSPKQKPVAEAPVDAPKALGWTDSIKTLLDDGQAMIPVVRGSKPVDSGPYLAGGPEGMSSDLGTVPGLPSTQVSEALIASDDEGAWVKPLLSFLKKNEIDPNAPLAFALDSQVKTKTLVRMANSARRAGYAQFGLMVNREEASQALGMFVFSLRPANEPLPDAGSLVVRIGQLGYHVTVKDAGGKVISEGVPRVPRRDNGKLDHKAFEARLDVLHAAHPDVTMALAYPNDDMPLDRLARLLSRLSVSSSAPRFTELALVLR